MMFPLYPSSVKPRAHISERRQTLESSYLGNVTAMSTSILVKGRTTRKFFLKLAGITKKDYSIKNS
jgi:hypothetical protein